MNLSCIARYDPVDLPKHLALRNPIHIRHYIIPRISGLNPLPPRSRRFPAPRAFLEAAYRPRGDRRVDRIDLRSS